MKTTSARLLLTVGLALALVPAVAAAKPKYGAFGKINGKKFKAKSNGRPDDNCVNGTYFTAGGIRFTAGECAGKKNKAPKKDFSQVLFVCEPSGAPKTPPFEATCAVAAYVEAQVKGGVSSDEKAWLSSVTFVTGANGLPVRQSAVTLYVDSFDGTVVKGRFSGVFDLAQVPGPPQVTVDKEVRFSFPVKAVQ
jgi:hypothetical protein